MQLNGYLSFEGRCGDAIAFYEKTIGARVVEAHRFKDHPCPDERARFGEDMAEKVMHAELRIGGSTLFVSDGMCQGGPANFSGFSLSLAVPGDHEAERVFNALAEGGEVRMPMGETFFASRFGMATDRFGVPWMVINPREAEAQGAA